MRRKLTDQQIAAVCRQLLATDRTMSFRRVCAELARRHGAHGRSSRVHRIWRVAQAAAGGGPPLADRSLSVLSHRHGNGDTATYRTAALGTLERFCAQTSATGGLVLIEAPAGAGKTQLLRDPRWRGGFARTQCAWLDSKIAAGGLSDFAKAIVRAAAECGVSRLEAPKIRAGSPGSRAAAFCEALCGAFVRHRRRLLLIIDDYHTIEGREINALLDRLTGQLPNNVTIVIATRRHATLKVSRPLMESRFLRLDLRALLFGKAEAREMLGPGVSATHLNQLYEVTEGWPAGLQIARTYLAYAKDGSRGIVQSAHFWRLLDRYCGHELLGDLPEATTEFLVTCAGVDRLEADLCDAIRQRDDSARILEALAASSTLLEPVDADRRAWCMPRLLREVLLRRPLDAAGTSRSIAARRAGAHFESQGRTLQAVRQYLQAGSTVSAATAIERAPLLFVIMTQGDSRGRELLDHIPGNELARFPRLGVCKAYLDFKQGLMEEARALFEEISASTLGFTRDRPDGDDAKLQVESMRVRLTLDLYRRPRVTHAYLREVEGGLPEDRGGSDLAMQFEQTLAILHQQRGDLDTAHLHYLQCDKLNANTHVPWVTLWQKYNSAALALARGHLMEARYRLQAGLKFWSRGFRSDPSYRALTGLALAEIHYELDETGEAQLKLHEGIYTAEHVEVWFEPCAAMYETALSLYLSLGQHEQSEALLRRGMTVPRIRMLLDGFLPVLRMRFDLARGSIDRACATAAEQDLEKRWFAENFQDEFAWREWDLAGWCLAHLALGEGSLDHAGRISRRLHEIARTSGRARTLARAAVLNAIVSHRFGHFEESMRHMREALELGHAHGYRRVFLDERHDVYPILERILRNGADALPAHLMQLVDVLHQTPPEPKAGAAPRNPDHLSEREQAVLRELSQGQSNKMIARRLSLSTPTINFHVRNLFRKLGVHRRAVAVSEGHRLGWLP